LHASYIFQGALADCAHAFGYNDDQRPAWVGAGRVATVKEAAAAGVKVSAPGTVKAARIPATDKETQRNQAGDGAAGAAGAAGGAGGGAGGAGVGAGGGAPPPGPMESSPGLSPEGSYNRLAWMRGEGVVKSGNRYY
jgi:hypothetical protein